MMTRGQVMLRRLPGGAGHDGELRGRAGGRHGADVGVVVLEAGAVSQLGANTAQCGELVCNEETVTIIQSTFILHSVLYQLNQDCFQL